MIKRDDDLFRGSEPLQAHDRAHRDTDSEKKDGLLGGDADNGDDDSGEEGTGHGDEAKDTDSDTTDSRSLDGKD